MVHYVRAGQRMPHRHRGGQYLSAFVEIDQMGPETAGPEV
jgi:hypothetical protein